MKQPNLDAVTGNFAVGSVIVGGVTLAVHAFADMKGFVGWIASLAVWEVMIAVPLLFVSYVIGLLTIRIASFWCDSRRKVTPSRNAQRVLTVARAKSDFVAGEYTRMVRELEMLQGACPAVGCLASGLCVKLLRAASDIGGHLHWGRMIFAFVDVALVALAVAIGLLARRQHEQVESLLTAIESAAQERDGGLSISDSQLKLRLR